MTKTTVSYMFPGETRYRGEDGYLELTETPGAGGFIYKLDLYFDKMKRTPYESVSFHRIEEFSEEALTIPNFLAEYVGSVDSAGVDKPTFEIRDDFYTYDIKVTGPDGEVYYIEVPGYLTESKHPVALPNFHVLQWSGATRSKELKLHLTTKGVILTDGAEFNYRGVVGGYHDHFSLEFFTRVKYYEGSPIEEVFKTTLKFGHTEASQIDTRSIGEFLYHVTKDNKATFILDKNPLQTIYKTIEEQAKQMDGEYGYPEWELGKKLLAKSRKMIVDATVCGYPIRISGLTELLLITNEIKDRIHRFNMIS